MREVFHQLYHSWGLSPAWEHPFAWAAALLSITVLAFVLGWVIDRILGTVIRRLAAKTSTQWDDYLLNKPFFDKLAAVVPALVGYVLLVSLLTPDAVVFPLLKKLSLLLICVTVTGFFDQLISNWEQGFLNILGDKKTPIRSYVQVAKILLFLVAAILIISIVLGQEPWGILSGIGALTAVLLLVFRDSLLGFVASLQLGSNNLVQIGDWIEIPSQGIEGEVIDIALSVVKIRSGDHTVYSLPTYNLVSSAFKNWRPVGESGARRIKIALPVDAQSLAPVLAEQQQRWQAQGLWQVPAGLERVSNLEAFRFWAQSILESHPDIHTDLARVVRVADPTGRGVVLEMVFYSRFTASPAWDHLHSRLVLFFLTALADFNLRPFQEPTGRIG